MCSAFPPAVAGVSQSRPGRELRLEDGGGRRADAAGEVPWAEEREQVQRSGRAPGEERGRRGGDELARSGARGAEGTAGRQGRRGEDAASAPTCPRGGRAGGRPGVSTCSPRPRSGRGTRPLWARPQLFLLGEGCDPVVAKLREPPRPWAHQPGGPAFSDRSCRESSFPAPPGSRCGARSPVRPGGGGAAERTPLRGSGLRWLRARRAAVFLAAG